MRASWAGALGLVALFVALLALEQARPLRERARRSWRRIVTNLALAALALIGGLLTVRPASVAAMTWAEANGIGLLHRVSWPPGLEMALGVLGMDLTFYYWHRANHRIALLWRFHNVHHVDPELDVTTAARFHAGEIVLSAGFRVVQVIVLGVPFWLFAVYEAIFQAGTLFHHSNLRLPLETERILNAVLVTPRMHGIHHSQIREETDSNYGVVLSWWDRLHRTLRLHIPQKALRIGVPAYPEAGQLHIGSLLALPFRAQRSYWQRGDDRFELRTPPVEDHVTRMAA